MKLAMPVPQAKLPVVPLMRPCVVNALPLQAMRQPSPGCSAIVVVPSIVSLAFGLVKTPSSDVLNNVGLYLGISGNFF